MAGVGEERNTYIVLVQKPEGNETSGRHKP